MLTAKQVAEYFISKDLERKLFNYNVVFYNDRKFYEGNVRINKYLFLAQVVYLAKYGSKLFSDDFVAYDDKNIGEVERDFLNKIYFSLENGTYEELIEITCEDTEWKILSKNTNKSLMNLEKNIDEYKKKYKGLIEALKI